MDKNIASLIPNAELYYKSGFNLMLIGPHGTGKTASIMELAEHLGIKVAYYSCSTLDPYTDLVGVPTPVLNEATGERYLEMVRPMDINDAELIFFDEFNRADSQTLNAIFEIIQFRSINGTPLPNLKACWAAMNPPEEGYNVDDVDPALLDRFDIYLDIAPRPDVQYMSTVLAPGTAQALKMWYDEHSRKGNKDANRMDYISPRRLVKLGQVWEATHNAVSLKSALPPGGKFDKQKLVELLKRADGNVAGKTSGGLGDSAFGVEYTSPALLADVKGERKVVTFLIENPTSLDTHQKVADTLGTGISGTVLVSLYGEYLDALNPSILEALINTLPVVKQSQMRAGFRNLLSKNKKKAQAMTNLYNVLSVNADKNTWPTL